MNDFSPHRVDWTREKSSRFWDHLSAVPAGDEMYFSAAVGDSLIHVVRSAGVKMQGRVLDFGSGPGHLIAKLLRNGVAAEGADFSAGSVKRVQDRFSKDPLFRGARVIERLPSDLPDASFDVVFFIETIEHLLGDDLRMTLEELSRIVKPGGYVVVSTPNEEVLATNEVMCPDCGCTFHRVQHVSSWSKSTLSSLLSQHGFEAVSVRSLYLQSTWLKSRIFTAGARIFGKPLPHLIYVGRRVAR